MVGTSASLGSLNAAVAVNTDATSNAGVVSLQVTGTYSGTITFEATTDGINWNAAAAYPTAGGQATQTTTGTGQFVLPVLGYNQVRARMSAYTSGAATVAIDAAAGSLNLPLTSTGAGMLDTVQVAGIQTAPTAGTAIATATTPGAGTWEVTVSTATGSAAVAADVGNMQLQKNAGVLCKLANPQNGGNIHPTVRVTLISTDTLTVNAVANATTAVVYAATMVLKRVA